MPCELIFETHQMISDICNDESALSTAYWFDANQNKLKMLSSQERETTEEVLGPVSSIKFKARDGADIYGYLTLPKSKKGEKPTLLVIPHGGPVGVADVWSYSSDVQYFASHGYAVLQVNYRVSGGRNKVFEKAGYGKLGFLPLHDIEDGIRYVIEQGWVKAEPVVGFGISYGGYAVLRGATLYPNRYQCLASMVGAYDIDNLLKNAPEHWLIDKSDFSLWHEDYPTCGAQALREISPLYDADKLTMPVFILHGEDDIRINLAQSNNMVAALRKYNKNVYYYTNEDGHELSPSETLDMILGFYDACLNGE